VLRGAQRRSRRHARILAQQGAALGQRAVQLAQVADHQVDWAWERSAPLGALAALALARHVGRPARVEVGARAVVGAARRAAVREGAAVAALLLVVRTDEILDVSAELLDVSLDVSAELLDMMANISAELLDISAELLDVILDVSAELLDHVAELLDQVARLVLGFLALSTFPVGRRLGCLGRRRSHRLGRLGGLALLRGKGMRLDEADEVHECGLMLLGGGERWQNVRL
jgi:hypothetical protein